MEKYDISYGSEGSIRFTFIPGEKGVTFRIPYGQLDFFRWINDEILGRKKLPTFKKGAGRYEYKVVMDRTGHTALRWIKIMEERGLCLLPIKRGMSC